MKGTDFIFTEVAKIKKKLKICSWTYSKQKRVNKNVPTV